VWPKHLLIGINGFDRGANPVESRQGRSMGAHKNLRPNAHHERERHINRRPDWLPQSIVPGIGNHADDLHPVVAVRYGLQVWRFTLQIRETQLLANRIALRPILPRKSLVNHAQACPAHWFRAVPQPPG